MASVSARDPKFEERTVSSPASVPKIPQEPDSVVGEGKANGGHLRLVETAPIPENRTVTPRRLAGSEYRDRKHLTPSEVEALYQAAKRHGRYGQRDALAIWMMFRHGLRVGELCGLRWTAHVDFSNGTLRVERLKNGVASVHPMDERTIRGRRRLQREGEGRYVFINERGQPMTDMGVRKMLRRVAATVPALAGLAIHPHMLRHSTGFALANKGMDTRSLQHYLGHRHIEHTEIYTAMAADRFDRVWD
jgi:site-specific recombinase XerD